MNSRWCTCRQANAPLEKAVLITDSLYQFTYSAYIGGSLKNGADVKVTFDVLLQMVDSFNLKNGTEPTGYCRQGSYVLNNLRPSSHRAINQPVLCISVCKTLGFILPFETTCSPSALQMPACKINNAISTTYYIITGSHSPGEVAARKSVLLLEPMQGGGTSMFDFGGKLIHKAPEWTIVALPCCR